MNLLLLAFLSCDESSLDLGNGYSSIIDPNGYRVIINRKNSSIVKGIVESFQFDENFITVKQNPIDSLCDCNYECYSKQDSSDNKSLNDCKVAINNSDLRLYWIVDKKSNSEFNIESRKYSNIYGPYSKESFEDMAQRLELPCMLIIK